MPKPVGLVGCASANCHGKAADVQLATPATDAWKTSCSVWMAVDPHGGAYAVLDPERNAIARRMQAAFAKVQPGYSTLADARCLACHTNPTLADAAAGLAPADALAALRAEGVSCEGCHGNASTWQATHTGWGTFDQRRAGMAAARMPELNDFGERAAVCAGCHVGGPADPARGIPARDMNHDMIAAGHPRLVFEFATHTARLPKHYLDRDRKAGGAPRPDGSAAVLWLAGQAAAAEAQSALAADRAARGSGSSQRAGFADPWPELADWNCYSCHHDLLPKSWRQAKLEHGRRPGRPGWDLPWPMSDRDAVNALKPGAGDRLDPLLKTLNTATRPDEHRTAAGELASLFADVRRTAVGVPPAVAPERAAGVFRTALANDRRVGWDDAYRMYLGLTAIDAARRDAATGLDRDLVAIGTALRLPQHPTEQAYRPDDVRRLLKSAARPAGGRRRGPVAARRCRRRDL